MKPSPAKNHTRELTSLPGHLYVHTPFCSGKCHYCAFHSGPLTVDPVAYICETLAPVRECTFQTIYFGGGTPGLLGPAGFQAAHKLGLLATKEFTVELHPQTVTDALLESLVTLGVTRISIGVQSFTNAVITHANRRHTVSQACAAISLARTYIPDTGIDLIAGLPLETAQSWLTTLDQALDLGLSHYSIYGLSIESGSVWADHPPPDDDQLMDALAIAQDRLAQAGIQRYETSNYAKRGSECQHNLNCWQGGDYLGLGSSASSRIGFMRQTNPTPSYTLSPEEDALERALTTLRLNTGFHPETLIKRFPILASYRTHWDTTLAHYRQHDLLNDYNAPTPRGYEVLDAMTRTLQEV